MKHIPKPDLSGARILTPAEMNRIHFGGNHTPLTPDKLKKLGSNDPKKIQEVQEAQAETEPKD